MNTDVMNTAETSTSETSTSETNTVSVSIPSISTRPRVVERLEYGKLCTRPDGPIVKGVECRTLGSSPKFDRAIAALCDPNRADGIRLGPMEDKQRHTFAHGTLLRPVLVPGGLVQVGSRLRRRPEDGDGGEERRYWMGRYLMSHVAPIDPLSLYSSFVSDPLRGLSKTELELSATPLAQPVRPPVDHRLERFLTQAMVYVMSGIPIGVEGQIDEEEFFTWATALWWLLPAPLRRLFSTGWGVSNVLCLELNLSVAEDYPPSVAVFRSSELTWTKPTEVSLASGGQRRVRRFDADVTLPGRMYLREFVGRDEKGRLDFKLLGVDSGAGERPALKLPTVVSPRVGTLDGPQSLARCFRTFGFYALDQARFRDLECWLAGGEVREASALCVSSADYTADLYVDRVLEHALRALADPVTRIRGEQVIWASLKGENAARHLAVAAGLSGSGSARMSLFVQLAASKENPLSALAGAIDAGEADALTPEVQQALYHRLDQSLKGDPDAPLAHLQLLRRSPVPEPYAGWVSSRLQRLTFFYFTSADPARREGLAALAPLGDDPLVPLLRRLVQLAPPTDLDRNLIQQLDREFYGACGQLLEVAWRDVGPADETARRREKLVAWIRLFAGLSFDDPIARIAGGHPAGAEAAEPISDAIQRGTLPPSLSRAVALELMHHWSCYSDRVKPLRWRAVLETLPPAVRWLLFEEFDPLGVNRTHPEIEQAAAELSLDHDALECLIFERRGQIPKPLQEEIWAWLWCWTSSARPRRERQATVVGLCSSLQDGRLPFSQIPDAVAQLTLHLVTHAGCLADLRVHQEALWQQAYTTSQIRFVLTLFADADLQPSTDQLAVMVEDYSWLKRHVEERGIHPDREERFWLSLQDFHTLECARERRVPFHPEFQQTTLWALYTGVPPQHQGDLKRALDVFDDLRIPHRRVSLAASYLTGQMQRTPPETRAFAARQVILGAIVPLWKDASATRDELEQLIEAALPSISLFTRIRRGLNTVWQQLTFQRRRMPERDNRIDAAVEGNQRVLRIHGDFLHLVKRTTALLEYQALLATIRGGFAAGNEREEMTIARKVNAEPPQEAAWKHPPKRKF